MAAGQLPQRHGVAKVAPGNDHRVHQRQKLGQMAYARLIFDLGEDLDAARPGFIQCPAEGADVLSSPHKGQHDSRDAAIGGNAQVLMVFRGEGRGRHADAGCGNAFPTMEHPAPQNGAEQCARRGGSRPQQQFSVVQQELLPGGHCLDKRSGAGNAALPQPDGLAFGERKRRGQPPHPQLRALQIDEQAADARFPQQSQPLGVLCQRAV